MLRGGDGGAGKAFSKNNNHKNAHLEGSQDVLNSKRVLEKMLRRFKCKWTQNTIIKFTRVWGQRKNKT